MHRASRRLASALLLALTTPAAIAAPRVPVSIGAGRLRDAVPILGEQQGISIGMSDGSLADLPTPALHGRMTAAEALRALVAALPARIVRIDARTYRIERTERAAPTARTPPRPAPPRALGARTAAAPSAPPPRADDEILISASKRRVGLSSYAGMATVIRAAELDRARGGHGSEGVLALIPSVTATSLGPSRNKLFIRGVADSSFNGPTQATVGQYLGDIRINYNAPDPDLELYDVAAVEVLEGPQGTLYGAGSLGGIFRIVPNPVRFGSVEATLSAGGAATAHGAAGGDVAAMLNVPLGGDAGLRGVAYANVQGGYIDDAARALRNVNRTRTAGGRLALAARLSNAWTIGLGGVVQRIAGDDGQYAERGLPARTRRSAIAQPFASDYALGTVTLNGSWGDMTALVAGGVVRHDVTTDYDFTPPGGAPTLFAQANAITLASGEARLSRSRRDGSGWLVGASAIVNAERLTRALGPVDTPADIAGVRNETAEIALFGELSAAVSSRLLLTLGARATHAHLNGRGLNEPRMRHDASDRVEKRFLPAAALAWRLPHALILFLRYEEGFRPGGLSVAGGSRRVVRQFRSDTIATVEGGARIGSPDAGTFEGEVSLSFARWRNIQADLVNAAGLPFTANVGDGRVLGFEARGRWRPARGLALDASLFLNDSRLVRTAPGFAASTGAELPNVAETGARLGVSYARQLAPGLDLSAAADARYVGHSRLGVGDGLDIRQGGYVDSGASVRLRRGAFGMTLGVTNLLDEAGNRFAYGDPFSVVERRQVTPLRPRTVRLGFDASF